MTKRIDVAIKSTAFFAAVLLMTGFSAAGERPEIFVQMGHTHNVTSVAFPLTEDMPSLAAS